MLAVDWRPSAKFLESLAGIPRRLCKDWAQDSETAAQTPARARVHFCKI